jgi:hypothetical protein
MRRLRQYLTLGAIIGPLPVQLLDGQIADAVPVMANFNWIVSQVNANASGTPASLTDIQVTNTASPSLTNNVNYPIGQGGTVVKDTLGEFSTVTGIFTATAAGVYLVSAMVNINQNGCTFSSALALSRVGSSVNCALGAVISPVTVTQAGTWVESVTLAALGTINMYVNVPFSGGPAKIAFAQLTITRLR